MFMLGFQLKVVLVLFISAQLCFNSPIFGCVNSILSVINKAKFKIESG